MRGRERLKKGIYEEWSSEGGGMGKAENQSAEQGWMEAV